MCSIAWVTTVHRQITNVLWISFRQPGGEAPNRSLWWVKKTGRRAAAWYSKSGFNRSNSEVWKRGLRIEPRSRGTLSRHSSCGTPSAKNFRRPAKRRCEVNLTSDELWYILCGKSPRFIFHEDY